MKANKIIKFIHLPILLILCVISCNKRNSGSQDHTPIHSVMLCESDTISLNDTFKAKVFLNNDYLYLKAKKEGVEDYLKVSFWNGNPNFELAEPIMIGDTAVIEFKIDYLDSLSRDSINQVTWENAFYINFDKSKPGHDTVFVTRSVIFLKK